eukprot:6513624-Pyramimonas_sp.AAC.1
MCKCARALGARAKIQICRENVYALACTVCAALGSQSLGLSASASSGNCWRGNGYGMFQRMVLRHVVAQICQIRRNTFGCELQL